jgi:hypothetical protein
LSKKAIVFALLLCVVLLVSYAGTTENKIRATANVEQTNQVISKAKTVEMAAAKTKTQNKNITLSAEQKQIVQFGRYVEYMAANYGGAHNDSAFITVEMSNVYIHKLSADYKIPLHYFTDGTYKDTIFAGYMPKVKTEDGSVVPLDFYKIE